MAHNSQIGELKTIVLPAQCLQDGTESKNNRRSAEVFKGLDRHMT